ncbi:MAG: hypothetical protein RMK57_00980 [Bryobacterales bacterium]|nr:hypothetical protein [Bryobacteraceae bacterium]MDW8353077.1 hypothetical protein [Bryobacterales bacterium]
MLVLAPDCQGQSLQVYSELQRVDPYGAIVPPDRPRIPGLRSREILSPAVARNTYASFHVVVNLPKGGNFALHVGQNPEGAFGVSLYKQRYARRDRTWIPEELEPVQLPFAGTLPERHIPQQTAQAFWLDLWIPARATPGRVRVEVQMHVNGRWLIYPMEVRVMSATVFSPPKVLPFEALGLRPADLPARRALIEYVCGARPSLQGTPSTVGAFLYRNARQDLALARLLESGSSPNAFLTQILRVTGASSVASWCAAPSFPENSPEWYLRAVRDFLLRMVH